MALNAKIAEILRRLGPAVLVFALALAFSAAVQAQSGTDSGDSDASASDSGPAASDTVAPSPEDGSTLAMPAAPPAGDDEIVVPVVGDYDPTQGPVLDTLSGPARREREDFSKSNQSMAEILESIPGVDVLESGGDEGPWKVCIRGGGEKGAAIYVDGIPISGPGSPYVDVSAIPPSLVEEVVVYRGSAPADYPAANTSGVVDIRTRAPLGDRHYHVSASIDTLDTKKLSLAYTNELLGGDAVFGTSHRFGGGRFEYEDDRGTPSRDSDDRTRDRTNNSFADHSFVGKWERRFGDYRVYAGGYLATGRRDEPGPGDDRAKSARSGSNLAIGYAGLRLPAALTSDLDVEARVHYMRRESRLNDEDGELGPPRDDSEVVNRIGLDAYLDYYGIRDNRLSFYIGLYNEEYLPESDLDPKVSDVEASRSSVYFNASDEVSFFGDRLRLKPRLRYVWEGNRYGGKTLVEQAGGEKSTTSFGAINFDISAGVAVEDNLWVLINGGQYFRSPDFLEEYGDRSILYGNPNLSAERSDNFEMSLLYDPGPTWEFDVFRAELAFFHKRTYNRIGYMPRPDLGPGVLRAENIGAATINGIELDLKLNYQDVLLVETSYRWQEAENDSEIDAFENNDLANMPANVVDLQATLYQFYGRLYYKGHYQDRRYLDEANTIEADPRFTHTIGIGYYQGNWTAGFEARNLTGDASRESLGRPLPGTSYTFLVEVRD